MAKTKAEVEIERLSAQLDHLRLTLEHTMDFSRQKCVAFDRLVNILTCGMDEGDRFYHAKDNTWWEWREGRLIGSGPPPKKPDPRVVAHYQAQKAARNSQLAALPKRGKKR